MRASQRTNTVFIGENRFVRRRVVLAFARECMDGGGLMAVRMISFVLVGVVAALLLARSDAADRRPGSQPRDTSARKPASRATTKPQRRWRRPPTARLTSPMRTAPPAARHAMARGRRTPRAAIRRRSGCSRSFRPSSNRRRAFRATSRTIDPTGKEARTTAVIFVPELPYDPSTRQAACRALDEGDRVRHLRIVPSPPEGCADAIVPHADARRIDDLQLVSRAAWIDRAGLLKQESVNDNCYTCHAEKAGPDAVGAPAGQGELPDLPRSSRIAPSTHADRQAAPPLPAVPR
jgi:hypothetical protein